MHIEPDIDSFLKLQFQWNPQIGGRMDKGMHIYKERFLNGIFILEEE